MATRRLDRTIIEGGRGESEKITRRERRRYERQESRLYLKTLCEEEIAYQVVWPETTFDRRQLDQHDRLSAMERYLERQVGRPWNDVYSELNSRYNRNSIRGFHLFSHIRSKTNTYARIKFDILHPTFRGSGEVYVDEFGFLRMEPRHRRKRESWKNRLLFDATFRVLGFIFPGLIPNNFN